jgi:hypothetical protein
MTAAFSRGSGIAITGARKVGKSSLATQYANVIANAPSCIINIGALSGPYTQQGLALEFARRCSLPDVTSFDSLLLALENRGRPPFMVIDEFGILFEYGRHDAQCADAALATARFLRTAVDGGLIHVALCNPRSALYTSPYVRTAIGEFDNPLLQRFEVLSLSGLKNDAALSMLEFYARRSLMTVPEETAKELASTCGGIPILVRAALNRATQERARPAVVTVADARAALERSSAVDAPWHIARTAIWKWALGWARPVLLEVARGATPAADDVSTELRDCGVLNERFEFGSPLLASIAREHSEDFHEAFIG